MGDNRWPVAAPASSAAGIQQGSWGCMSCPVCVQLLFKRIHFALQIPEPHNTLQESSSQTAVVSGLPSPGWAWGIADAHAM